VILSEKQLNSAILLGDLFRQEYPKMTALLCRRFGLKHMEIAEDIVGETFLKASENWTKDGVPENPAAWLYIVAKNKAKDHLKRVALFETQIVGNVTPREAEAEPNFEFEIQHIKDGQLAMIFAVCDPDNSTEGQISLALQILCGFTVEEIASAFLAKTETIKKRLHRAKTRLRTSHFHINALDETNVRLRLDNVLKTLYLLFNEGYFSKSNDKFIRNELCAEAIRLAFVLTENPLTDTAQTNALLALMCYQSSRIEARTSSTGEMVTFEEQDQSLWNKDLIERGNYYLVNACHGNEVSKYHLEAGIAYWHTNAATPNKWQHILQLYNQLILIEYSPVAALNRAFAIAKVNGHEKAIRETEKLNLSDNDHYYKLLGYLYETVDVGKAIDYYSKAAMLTKPENARLVLEKEIQRLKKL
jgi:RNA polymerase sigma factor (sigma-70 family)